MSKAANIYVRVKPEVKEQAERVFDNFGMTVSEAVNIFLHKAIMVGGIPFEVRPSIPNIETVEAIHEIEQMEKDPSMGKGYTDIKLMMKELLG